MLRARVQTCGRFGKVLFVKGKGNTALIPDFSCSFCQDRVKWV